jgi:hypothetical protein
VRAGFETLLALKCVIKGAVHLLSLECSEIFDFAYIPSDPNIYNLFTITDFLILAVIFTTQPIFLRFEVFMAVTTKNSFSWDIRTHFIPHRKHISVTKPNLLMLCKI